MAVACDNNRILKEDRFRDPTHRTFFPRCSAFSAGVPAVLQLPLDFHLISASLGLLNSCVYLTLSQARDMADSFKMHGEKDAVSFPNLLWGHFREILAGINVEVHLDGPLWS
jgi:hypothetical protein